MSPKQEWLSIGIAAAALIVTVVMSLGGWKQIAEYRHALIVLAALLAVVVFILVGRKGFLWFRKRRMQQASRLSAEELAFRAGFHSQDVFVVNTRSLGSVDLVPVHAAARATFGSRTVKFEEIVTWLSHGAPEPISGHQSVPRAASKAFRQGFRDDWIAAGQMADQLIRSEVFVAHGATRSALTWGR